MNVKEAVSLAKQYIAEAFSEEKIANLGLEEVEFDEKAHVWSVTIGFSRPWDESGPFGARLAFAPRRRDYKVVRIADGDKSVLSVRNHETVQG